MIYKERSSVRIETDFLVIGSGIAGLTFALQIAEYGEVVIITKKEDKESNTNYAQGGIASVIDKTDSFVSHIRDTITAGAGLCHEEAVRFMVKNGPKAIKQLLEIGVHFSRNKEGKLELGREGGHSKNRIVHAYDFTGTEIEHALINRIKDHPRIQILQNHIAVDLITEHQTPHPDFSRGIHCWGSYVFDIENNIIKTVIAKITMLCTGGCGQVYLHTSNPAIATGDGIAIAYRAGAKIANLEFMQFHPTTVFHPLSDSFLISESVRGFGAILRNRNGSSFMHQYHPMKELAPRDIVARAIDREMKKSGQLCVYLDLTHKNPEDIKKRFPNIYKKCLEFKIDMTKEWIPVVPAAHYMCGGLVVDMDSKTNIERLFACGEVACTGVHGANRLASNSLLEAVVFADTAVKAASKQIKNNSAKIPEILPWNIEGTFNQDEWVYIVHDRQVIRTIMWDYVGIVRSNFRLKRALKRLEMIEKEVEKCYKKTTVTPELIELRNIATVARLIAKSAISRKESRGLHYNTDFPEKNDDLWLHDTIISNPVS
jgi:L-aspartate oxidase